MEFMILATQVIPYTWSNKREGGAAIFERLDITLVNVDWRSMYPDAFLLHLPITGSDQAKKTTVR